MKMKLDWTVRRYIVPPLNRTRVVISQRHDIDSFYVSVEDYHGEGVWVHREGSSRGGYSSLAVAEQIAEELFAPEVSRKWLTVPKKKRQEGCP